RPLSASPRLPRVQGTECCRRTCAASRAPGRRADTAGYGRCGGRHRRAAAPASNPERGPLAESVPRRMRSGIPATAEVRIARDKIDGLMLALCNRGVRPEAYPTRTLAVRLRAPNGGFAIEANSPETQWIDRSTSAPGDSFAGWRWTIT